MKRVLFVCVHNAGRSQMAEAFAKHLAPEAIGVESAGTMPAQEVDPLVVQVMREAGINMPWSKPKLLTPAMVDRADRVITMGCSLEESCPALLVPAEDWGLADPQGSSIDEVRRIRDQVEARVMGLLNELQSEAV